MLSAILEQIEPSLAASDAPAASRGFFTAMERHGATYLQTRVYRRPIGALTSANHWAAGGVITRIAPPAWAGSAAFNFVCFECNPLLAAIREGRSRYRFSDFAPWEGRKYGSYWDALAEAHIGEGLCATSYGPGGSIASLHLGFDRKATRPDLQFAIQLAGLALTERLLDLAAPQSPAAEPRLTTREKDCMTLVAEGKTDWEISEILGVSEATIRFHVDNARRKVDAVSRAQAVARLIGLRKI